MYLAAAAGLRYPGFMAITSFFFMWILSCYRYFLSGIPQSEL
jgi:hypothetical protein